MDACSSGGATNFLADTRTALFRARCSATAAVHSEQPARWAAASCCAATSNSSSTKDATFSRQSQFMILLPTSCLPVCPATLRSETALTVCAPLPGETLQFRSEYPAPAQSPDISSLPDRPGSALPESRAVSSRFPAAPAQCRRGG